MYFAPFGFDQFKLVERFHAFDRGFHTQRVRQADNRGDNLRAILVLLRTAIDKALVDFDLVERRRAQIAERRIPRPEIIKR